MSDLEILKKVKDAIIFEAAWLYETTKDSKKVKEDRLEYIKVVWNRAFPRAGGAGYFEELSFDEEDIKKAAEMWDHEDEHVSGAIKICGDDNTCQASS